MGPVRSAVRVRSFLLVGGAHIGVRIRRRVYVFRFIVVRPCLFLPGCIRLLDVHNPSCWTLVVELPYHLEV